MNLGLEPMLPRRRLLGLGILLVSAMVLTVRAAWSAREAHGKFYPSIFVDPGGSRSFTDFREEDEDFPIDELAEALEPAAVTPAVFHGKARCEERPLVKQLDLRNIDDVDRSYTVGGIEVTYSGKTFYAPADHGNLFDASQTAGDCARKVGWDPNKERLESTITFVKANGATLARVALPLRRVGERELLLFFCLYALAAWMILWSGVVLFRVCGRPMAGNTYLFWAVSSFTLLMTLFDAHTGKSWMTPLFLVSTTALPTSALWLAYGFPEPPHGRQRLLRGAVLAVSALYALMAVWLVAAWSTLAPWPPGGVRIGLDVLLALALASLPAAAIIRLRRASERNRAELVAASWGLIVTPLVITASLALTLGTHKDFLHPVLPFLVVGFPLSVGYALIRNNILATSAILSPRVVLGYLASCILIVSLVGAYATYTAIRGSRPVNPATVAIFVGLFLFSVMSFWAHGTTRRLFFPAAHQFRPTIERLSDQITSLRDMGEVRQTVQGLVKRWLPTHTARVLEPQDLGEVKELPPGARERLARGEPLWTEEGPWHRHLLMPMCSLGELRGVLMVAPKEGAALFTEDDLSLLDTMASLSAVALHHAEVLQEVDRLRRLELETAKDEKRRVLDFLGEAMSHEIGHPLDFLLQLLDPMSGKVAFSDRDVETGRKEVERLKRMLRDLRRLQLPSPELGPTSVLPPIQRALDLVREKIRVKRIQVELQIPTELVVVADADALVQVFSNLLRNAAEAVEEEGRVGVRSHPEEEKLVLEVWDTGPGVPEAAISELFKHTVSSKEHGMGIGLAISKHIIKGFGWNIEYHREGGRTCFRILVPSADVTPPGLRRRNHEGLDRR